MIQFRSVPYYDDDDDDSAADDGDDDDDGDGVGGLFLVPHFQITDWIRAQCASAHMNAPHPSIPHFQITDWMRP